MACFQGPELDSFPSCLTLPKALSFWLAKTAGGVQVCRVSTYGKTGPSREPVGASAKKRWFHLRSALGRSFDCGRTPKVPEDMR